MTLAGAIGGGHYAFRGRRDDILSVGGENLYTQEVERLLLGHLGVTDVCVVARPHEVKGRVPIPLVDAHDRVTVESFKGYALENGPAYAHPREIHLVSSMPLGSTGGARRAAESTLGDPAAPGSGQEST